jgi:adenosylcobinamide kinase / adenosylcobinamide-phosphate guanylyltransferase
MERKLIFLLGGARSGKSTYAERWARTQSGRVLFVATAQAFDDEMHTRITAHRAERPASWDTLEAPYDLAATLDRQLKSAAYDTVLIDCLTLLVSNVLLRQPEDCDQSAVDQAVAAEVEALLAVYPQQAATWLIVSNEVGMGVVPPTRLGRFYRDALGRANQRVAQVADEVMLLVAGLPWSLKRPG